MSMSQSLVQAREVTLLDLVDRAIDYGVMMSQVNIGPYRPSATKDRLPGVALASRTAGPVFGGVSGEDGPTS